MSESEHTVDTASCRTPDGTTSVSLIVRIKQNEPDAWNRLVQLYSPLVYSWCRRSGLGPDDAADVMQDAFGAVAVGIGNFRRQKSGDTFRGWLRVITRNCIRDHFRKFEGMLPAAGGTDIQLRFLDLPMNENSEEESQELADLYRRALELVAIEFEESTRQAFLLTVIEGRRSGEVADLLGTSAGAVRQAKYRVLNRLREELGDSE